MRFKQFILNEADPMNGGSSPLGDGPAPGSSPAAMPPGGMDPIGSGVPPMGGMDPMGGGGMGGAPMGGGGMDPMGGGGMGGMGGGSSPGGIAPQIPVKMKDADVWSVLEKLLDGHPQHNGNQNPNMVRSSKTNHLMS